MAAFTGTFGLGPDCGRVLLRTGRSGLAARAGHDLTIEVTRWSARVSIPADDAGGPAAGTLSAEIDLGSLAVREGTGGAKPLSDKDRSDIAATAAKILNTSGGAVATFASSQIIPSGGGGAIEGTVTLHGRSQPARLEVASPAPGSYRGSATLLQTGFGITPYTGFFGALKLRDEVTVEFEADLNRAATTGQPGH